MRRMLISLLLAGTCLAGCGRSPPSPSPPPPPAAAVGAHARAEQLRARLGGMQSVQGRRQWPGLESAYQAYFEGRVLRYLEETVTVTGGGPFQNHYYFEPVGLFYYSGEQAAAADSGAMGPAPRVSVIAEWRGMEVVRAVRIEHYGEVPLAAPQIGAIRRRAAELASAAQDELTAKGAP